MDTPASLPVTSYTPVATPAADVTNFREQARLNVMVSTAMPLTALQGIADSLGISYVGVSKEMLVRRINATMHARA